MKKKRKFNCNTSMSVVDYAILVESMASEFFNLETGEYQPHLGTLNVMRVFYNTFYRDMEKDDAIIDALDMNEIVDDEEFIEAFNNAIDSCSGFRLDFANAYRDVIDIVETRKTSVGRMFAGIKNGIEELVEVITPTMDEENINKIFSVVQEIAKGNVNMSKIVKTYGKDNVATQSDNVTQTGKVVSIDHAKKK